MDTSRTNFPSHNITVSYPSRYYASYDTHAAQPTTVTGWYDTWTLSDLAHVPPANEMIALTEEEWNDQTHFRLPLGRGVHEGKIVDYTPPPPPPPPLKNQAQAAMQSVQQQANMITAMSETFGPQMRDYVGRLRDIANGTDTTSTELPTAPSDPTH